MTAKKRTVADMLPRDACDKAKDWARGYTSAAKAWAECQRGDWMLWLCGRYSGPPESDGRKKLVLTTCACARLALPHANGDAARKCIETAERWAKGKASIEELREAQRYAAAAAATYAAYAAATAYAAAPADSAAAATKVLAQCADIVRQHYPKPPKGNP